MNRWKPFARMQRILALALCAVLLCVSAPAYAQEAYAQHRTVKVGFFAMEGYHMEDAAGVRSGYGYAFLQLVARYSNLRFEYVGYDKGWDDMLRMLENGEIDLLTSAQKTPERAEKFEFSATLIGTSAAILTVKANDTRYNDGNYNGMRIGLVQGSSRNAQLDDGLVGFRQAAQLFALDLLGRSGRERRYEQQQAWHLVIGEALGGGLPLI